MENNSFLKYARYTDDNYYSKSQLKSSFGFSGIDYVWKEVIAYRQANSKGYAPFRTIAGREFHLTLTPAIQSKINRAEESMSRLSSLYEESGSGGKETIRRLLLARSLASVRDIEGIKASELSLKAMVSGRYAEGDPTHRILLNYLNAADYFAGQGRIPAYGFEDVLAEIYSRLLGVSELTSFYRNKDEGNARSLGGLYEVYPYAPYERIESLMQGFEDGIYNQSVSPFVKAVMSVFYFHNVKPFDRYSAEVGALLSLDSAARSGLGPSAYFLPISAFLRNDGRFLSASEETQKTGDATYVVLLAADILVPILESLYQEVRRDEGEEMKKENATLAPQEKLEAEKRGLFELPKEDYRPEIKEVPVEPKKEEIKPVEVKPVEPRPVEPKPVVRQTVPAVEKPGEAAFDKSLLSAGVEALSEKEAKEYARYLVETNPHLSKGQAKFYAFHCTMGRYYVIQQYKKFCRCAYETARTSMDKLASEGYYRKLQVKNKFVYTPNKQGE